MSVDYSGVQLKLERAQFHLETIHAEIREFIKGDLYGPSLLDLDTEQEWQTLRWENVSPIPGHWGVVLGDFAHNCRSALDQIMCRLVEFCGAEAGYHTQFPIAVTEKQWNELVTRRDPASRKPRTHGLTDEATKVVRDCQPFVTHPGGAVAPLQRLSEISNRDKHRTLHGARAGPRKKIEHARFEPRGYVAIVKIRDLSAGNMVENGAEFAEVKIRVEKWPPPGIQMRMVFESPTVISFFDRDRKIIDLAELESLLIATRDIVQRIVEIP